MTIYDHEKAVKDALKNMETVLSQHSAEVTAEFLFTASDEAYAERVVRLHEANEALKKAIEELTGATATLEDDLVDLCKLRVDGTPDV